MDNVLLNNLLDMVCYLIPILSVVFIIKEMIVKLFIKKKNNETVSQYNTFGFETEVDCSSLRYIRTSNNMWSKRAYSIYKKNLHLVFLLIAFGFLLTVDFNKQSVLAFIAIMYVLISITRFIVSLAKRLILVNSVKRKQVRLTLRFNEHDFSIMIKHMENIVRRSSINYNTLTFIKEYKTGLQLYSKIANEDNKYDCIIVPKYCFEDNQQYNLLVETLKNHLGERFYGFELSTKSYIEAYANTALLTCLITLLISKQLYISWFLSIFIVAVSLIPFLNKYAKLKSIIALSFGLYSFYTYTLMF